MCTHYVIYMDYPNHLHFPYTWISFSENIFDKDFIFDRWKKSEHKFENFIIKARTKM